MYLIEEFFYSALEMKHFQWADFFLRIVKVQFPKTVKVMRMLGMYHEAVGQGSKAQEIYLELIQNEP
jgi:hypothetical protein